VEYLVLCLTAAMAGAINAIAGGGTLLTFPALLMTLGGSAEAAVVANVTSTIALCPGSVASMWGYRQELKEMVPWLKLLILPSLLGGAMGSWLVLQNPNIFQSLIPWLILSASLLFALQPRIARWMGIGQEHVAPNQTMRAGIVAFQFLVGVYGGYFGAGIGILMLTSLAMMGLADIHRMNALKTALATCMNGISVVIFMGSGRVHWPFAAAMAVAAIAGGYGGARMARRMNRNLVRYLVIAIGLTLSAFYFLEYYLPARSSG
jgi:uncharacterized membrane protein YfcA